MACQWRPCTCSLALTQRRSVELENGCCNCICIACAMCVSAWGAGSSAAGIADLAGGVPAPAPGTVRARGGSPCALASCAGKARPPLVLSAALLLAAPKAPGGWLAASCCRRAGQSCMPCPAVMFSLFFMGDDGEGRSAPFGISMTYLSN